MLNWITPRTIPVEFRDVSPHHIVDTARFVDDEYTRMKRSGFRTSFFAIVHAAAVHYQGKHRRSPSRRFANAFIDLLPVVARASATGGLRLDDRQSSEFQSRTSEVLGVGLCVLASTRLFGVNRNRIEPIERAGKRCDFRVTLETTACEVESKGRKNLHDLSPAINDVFAKKHASPNTPAYGFVSHLPRNNGATSMIVVDPDHDDAPVGRVERTATILTHYSRLLTLSGFWRLSELLNARVAALDSQAAFDELNRQPIEFGSVRKLGRAYRVAIPSGQFEFFGARDPENGLQIRWKNLTFVMGIDPRVYDLLVEQDFDELEHYSVDSAEYSDSLPDERFAHSVLSDGSALIAVPHDRLRDTR